MFGIGRRSGVMRAGRAAPLLVLALLAALAVACTPDTLPTRAALVEVGDPGPRAVTLTFDAGSDAGNTAAILDLLKARGIIAGFGVTGRFAEANPALVQRMVREGHQIINHSYSHPRFSGLTTAQRAAELDRTERVFQELGVSSYGWFRPPEGDTNVAVETDLAARGYYLDVKWTIDTLGWRTEPRSSVQTVLDQVFTSGRLRNGAIILMHVGALSVDYAALPSVLYGLQTRGYGYASPAQALTVGAIGAHYDALGAQRSLLGVPRTVELAVPNGRWQLFARARMYWSPATAAREVHGAVLDEYLGLGTTSSVLGFPVTDERTTPDRIGRYNHFQQSGSIYWTPATGAHEVHGAIRAQWAGLGWETSRLGYPTSDEYAVSGGRRSDFQHGSIVWDAATRATAVTYG